MSTENVVFITPAQCRAARALLELTQPELAKHSSLGLSTIVDFEKSRRRISSSSIDVLKNTLERLGIQFIDENGGGAGVRLRNPAD